jgi:TPR repeat protein
MNPNPHDDDAKKIRDLIDSGRVQDAFTHCQPSAAAGSTMAQLYLGWMHQSGKGTPMDLDKAEHWYRQALEADPSRASYYLATVYKDRNKLDQAREWFEASVYHDYAPAMYQLGQIHRFGYGVSIDEKKGWAFIDRAAQRGHVFARSAIARDMLRGRRGVLQIPIGFFLLMSVLWSGARIAAKEPHHDQILRLI